MPLRKISCFYKLYIKGMLAFGVVREFLEFFNLDFTTAVLDPESNVWLFFWFVFSYLKETFYSNQPKLEFLTILARFYSGKQQFL